jgi:peroxiredoxin
MLHETKTLKYMQKVPTFKLTAHDGSIYAQHHYTGHSNMVVLFFSSAKNPRCQEQMKEYGAHLGTARAYKTVLIGIAPDDVQTLGQVHRALALGFPLLFDQDLVTARRYGIVRGLLRKRVRPTVVVNDQYCVAHYVAVAERDEDRPRWEIIEDILRRFPRL